MNLVAKYVSLGFFLLATVQILSGHPTVENEDHLQTQNNNAIEILNSPDGRELLNLVQTFMKHHIPMSSEHNAGNSGKKAQDPSTTAATEEIRDLHELVRAVIERNLTPVVQQILTGLNVPALFGGTTEAPATSSSPPITTTKQYIYLYLQRESEIPQSEPVVSVTIIPESVQFKQSEGISNSTPMTIPESASTIPTKPGKYMIVKNKNKINVTQVDMAGNEALIDDEDETDILKKVQSLP